MRTVDRCFSEGVPELFFQKGAGAARLLTPNSGQWARMEKASVLSAGDGDSQYEGFVFRGWVSQTMCSRKLILS